ncbi:isoleucine--tRNA ligase, mitochondrial [Macrosteles quadrilineatus]|uniref:isoleucine--tRNA ligase, mitochondrial n=1 Tax=Macrosteles quadrilineatus TaxID=74068 RepID=UPI0023E2CF2C|nr:isoleucine--tRNA ligase, mitochondrial [Macrosteles quadrilineatus]
MYSYSKLLSVSKLLRCTCLKSLKHKSAEKVAGQEKTKINSSIILPKTDFPLWLKGNKRTHQDEKIMNECGFNELYNWQRENVKGTEYVLHDGPPYANGLAHMGHAINKILKDITIRNKLLQGHRIHYKPGWDCHGLPIELKAMAGENVANLSPLTIRSKARKFAKEAIRDQKAVFKSWGVMADWEKECYYTFDKSYVKNELQQFLKLYNQGIIFRDFKPVYWSPSSKTALAESELEYKEDHVSTSTHVRVRVTNAPATWGEVYALLWTTTPWSLPANQAVAYSPTLEYSLVTIEGLQGHYLVAKVLVDELASTIGKKVSITNKVDGNVLPTLQYDHPVYDGKTLPFLASEHVTASKGTGLVHTAPAHGPDDFKLAVKYNLSITCLVDENGSYTAEAGDELKGKEVLTHGTAKVLNLCKERDVLVHKESFKHSYPYDWRTNLPVILRASKQWFLDTAQVKQQAVECLQTVRVMPEKGLASLTGYVQNRPFWCISRQRTWGVPIPVLYTSDGQPLITQELVDHYCNLLESEGDDFWWSSSVSNLAPAQLLDKLNVSPSDVEKGQDVLDIWLDSGLSWSAALESGQSADLYLEGLDQFNGWFQSSLITSVALRKTPPYKTIFYHGFAVDEKGNKMSKSLGNVVNPQDIVYGGKNTKKHPIYGLDVLRWWVAAHATQHTVPVSETTLSDSKASVQRLRMIFKFLLGTLDKLPPHSKPPSLNLLDSYLLHCLHNLEKQVMEYYNNFQYNRVCLTLMNFVANEVSSLYCHSIKDRLYCDEENSVRRRAAQLVCYHTLNTLTRLVAPILPVLAEEVYSYTPVKVTKQLFHALGPCTQQAWNCPEVVTVISTALSIKEEIVRLTPLNCNSLELAAKIVAPSPTYEILKELQDTEDSYDSELSEILQVSRVTLSHNSEPAEKSTVEVSLIDLHHCERCRKYTAPAADQLCPRCDRVFAAFNSSV